MFSMFTTPAQIKKLTTYSGDKSSYVLDGTLIIEGFFTPISPSQDAIAQGIISQTYQFITDIDQDIDDGDILVINGVDYGVKGTASYQMDCIEFLRCIIEKSVNL